MHTGYASESAFVPVERGGNAAVITERHRESFEIRDPSGVEPDTALMIALGSRAQEPNY